MTKVSTDYPGLPKTVSLLIVEDENRLRELLAEVADEMGFAATEARTAGEAIRLMNAEPRGAIMLDLNLPGIGGMDLLATVRERWPETQVIILTGFGTLESARQAIHLDVVEFLTKPCPVSEVEKALHRARRKIDERRIAPPPSESPATVPAAATLAEHERQVILAAIQRHEGNRTAAARELGVSRRTLHYKLREYQEDGWEVR